MTQLKKKITNKNIEEEAKNSFHKEDKLEININDLQVKPKSKVREESPKTKLKNLIDGKVLEIPSTIKPSKTLKFEEEEKEGNMGSNNINSQCSLTKEASDSKDIFEFPINIKKHGSKLSAVLTEPEMEEIKNFEYLYYFNLNEKAIKRKFKLENPIDYEDSNNDYRLIVGEHILYRYEIIDRYHQ